jgi:hypothetical protein
MQSLGPSGGMVDAGDSKDPKLQKIYYLKSII